MLDAVKKEINKRELSVVGLIFAVLLAVALRVFIVFGTDLPWSSADTIYYFKQADALLGEDWLEYISENYYYFPNGYPLFVALIGIVSPLSRELSLVICNIVFSSAVVGFVYLISWSRTTSNVLAICCALGVAAWPNQLNYVPKLLSEVPSTFLLIGGVAALHFKYFGAGGLLVGMSAIVRTSLMPVGILIPAILYFFGKKREALVSALSFLFVIVASLAWGYYFHGIWFTGRNFGHDVQIAIISALPQIDYTARGVDFIGTVDAIGNYFEYFLTDPIWFLYQRLYSLWELWGFWPSDGKIGRSDIVKLVIGLRFPLLMLALYAAVRNHHRSYSDYILLCPVLVLTVVHAALFSTPRFSYPAEPALIVLAVEALLQTGMLRHLRLDSVG